MQAYILAAGTQTAFFISLWTIMNSNDISLIIKELIQLVTIKGKQSQSIELTNGYRLPSSFFQSNYKKDDSENKHELNSRRNKERKTWVKGRTCRSSNSGTNMKTLSVRLKRALICFCVCFVSNYFIIYVTMYELWACHEWAVPSK